MKRSHVDGAKVRKGWTLLRAFGAFFLSVAMLREGETKPLAAVITGFWQSYSYLLVELSSYKLSSRQKFPDGATWAILRPQRI